MNVMYDQENDVFLVDGEPMPDIGDHLDGKFLPTNLREGTFAAHREWEKLRHAWGMYGMSLQHDLIITARQLGNAMYEEESDPDDEVLGVLLYRLHDTCRAIDAWEAVNVGDDGAGSGETPVGEGPADEEIIDEDTEVASAATEG